ncbi:protein kinase [Endozoicomonas sp. Mp262]|uniref:protein kinase domain-containing protein n=1 Tax=Endozoicomonas sp. Mp262 TaxID=2919499 RepID=UPI0021D9818F
MEPTSPPPPVPPKSPELLADLKAEQELSHNKGETRVAKKPWLSRKVEALKSGIITLRQRKASSPESKATSLPPTTKLIERKTRPFNISHDIVFNRLGEGNFGRVDQVLKGNETHGKLWVAKTDKETHEQVIDNEEIMRHLGKHPNIVRVDFDKKLMRDEGHPLSTLIDMTVNPPSEKKRTPAKINSDQKLPASLIRNIGKQLFTGINYIHAKGITHFDLKPENILIGKEGNVKIADFGCARRCKPGEFLAQGSGDNRYMPPDVFPKGKARSTSLDNWSAGCCLYELVSGNKLVESPRGIFTEIYNVKHWKDLPDGAFYNYAPVESFIKNKLKALEVSLKEESPRRFSDVEINDLLNMLKLALQAHPKKRGGSRQLLNDPFFLSPRPTRR